MLLTLETCTTALGAAIVNRKTAVQLELAVGLAVFFSQGGPTKEARKMLVSAFAMSGYECSALGDKEYKTVNRRINATASLYDKLPISKWVGTLEGMNAIHAIFDGIGPYGLETIQDVLRFAAPAKAYVNKTRVKPDDSILGGPVGHASGQEKVMTQFRRASDQIAEGSLRVSTEHLSLAIPKDVDHDEIVRLAMQLLSLAVNNEKELLTA